MATTNDVSADDDSHYATSSLVTITVVGSVPDRDPQYEYDSDDDETTDFFVHKAVLFKSPYFRTCFSSASFSEARSGIVKFRDETHTAVGLYISWLYENRVIYPEHADRFETAAIIAFADKMIDDAYHNNLMDAFRFIHRQYLVHPGSAVKLYQQGIQTSEFIDYMIKQAVYETMTNDGELGITEWARIFGDKRL